MVSQPLAAENNVLTKKIIMFCYLFFTALKSSAMSLEAFKWMNKMFTLSARIIFLIWDIPSVIQASLHPSRDGVACFLLWYSIPSSLLENASFCWAQIHLPHFLPIGPIVLHLGYVSHIEQNSLIFWVKLLTVRLQAPWFHGSDSSF